MQVHKENIERVPNSIKGRDNISLEICGMDNIPEEDLIEHEKQKSMYSGARGVGDSAAGDSDSDSDSSSSKQHQPPPLPSSSSSSSFINKSNSFQPPPPSHQAPPLPPVPPPPPPPPGTNPLMMMPTHHPMMYNPHHMAMMGHHHPMMPPPHAMIPHPMMIPPLIPPQQQQQQPLPLMSQQTNKTTPQPLMAFNVTPTGNVAATNQSASNNNINKPLFPAALNIKNDDPINSNSIILPNKIEILAPGNKIIHPEDDISLVIIHYII